MFGGNGKKLQIKKAAACGAILDTYRYLHPRPFIKRSSNSAKEQRSEQCRSQRHDCHDGETMCDPSVTD